MNDICKWRKNNTTKKVLAISLTLPMLLSVLTNCDSGGTGPGNIASGQNPAGSGDSTDKETIGMVAKNTSTEYIQTFVIGAQEACDKYDIELKIADGKADNLKIVDTIDAFIIQGIDGFILAGAEDLATLVPRTKRLNEEGVPVPVVDTCPEGGHVDMFVTNGIVDSPRKAVVQVAQGTKDANGGEIPKDVIIEITDFLVDMYTTECHEGFSSMMEQYPRLTVMQGKGHWNSNDSHSRTGDLLTRYGDDMLGIYIHAPDITGSGVAAAVKTTGLDPADYSISGVCIGVEGMHLFNKGRPYAVVEQPALDMTTMAVEHISKMLNGEEIPKVGNTITKEGALWSPVKVINNEFADSGATMILQSSLVPQECQPSDERLYENRIG